MASNVENVSASQLRVSSEMQEMFCEECEQYSTEYKPAEGYCVDCCMYLCEVSLLYHKGQQHNIQDKYTMPQDSCSEKCSAHSNKRIKFYCENCEEIACSECKKTHHQNCLDVSDLAAVVKGDEQAKELEDLLEDMGELSEDLENTKKEIKSNVEYIASQETIEKLKISNQNAKRVADYSKLQEEIIENFDKQMEETTANMKRERQKLVEKLSEEMRKFQEKLDNAEKDLTKACKSLTTSDQTNLDSLMEKTLTIIDELKISSANLKGEENSGKKCHLFIAIKNAKHKTRNLRNSLSEIKKENRIKYNSTEQPQTNQTNQTPESNTSHFSYEETPEPRKETTAAFYSSIETHYSGFQTSCLLSVNTLTVAYSEANSLLLVQDIMQKKPAFQTIYMFSKLWAITKVKDNKVAVTLPNEGTIRLITFSNSMTVTNSDDIKVKGRCYGISCSNDYLIVSTVSHFFHSGKVQILDMSGNVLKVLDKDCNNKALFSNPLYLALSPDNETIYVSDWDKNTVTCLTFDGKIKAIYKDNQLLGPCQLTTDELGSVYVCGRLSNNVHQLSPLLNKVKILLDGSEELAYPVSVSHCMNKNRLYLGMWSNNIKVFNLSQV
ncbi:uncharacterized protein LOC128558954 [Mercenaria mercenaria]|uniref:uncharacterized protein LOC128558954 n=1 Tax=Mercenaria mercenaria TaxID=6596 RepID=UPI00234F130D|nr:uncharacterized protein LOC128558954 [Mercenaria mercenaria]